MTPQQFAKHVAGFHQRLQGELVKAEAQTAREAKAAAVRLSSGTQTAAQLRRAGHPYARRAPTAASPEVINAQAGLLRDSWQSDGPREASGGLVTKVYNLVPYGRYLASGTKTAIARPLVAAVLKKVQPGRQRRLAAAAGKAWGG